MISLKTHKMLWGRSGNMCAFPGCKKVLVIDETETDDPSIIGEEAHIVAQRENGPRGLSDLTAEQRDKYENLILLCTIHHKVIDDQQLEYTADKLKQYKKEHENWVKENLIQDPQKIKDDELYVTYIEKFIYYTDIHNWYNWTSWIVGSTQIFPKKQFDLLKELPNYIVSRVWPNRYNELEASLINFKNVVNDLMMVYHVHLHERPDGYTVEKFYKAYNFQKCERRGEEYNAKEEALAVERYYYHWGLIEDLLLELTRAANYVCDKVRQHIFQGFRLEEGVLLIMRGDLLQHQTYRVEYRGDERIERPYPGLREFMELRKTRDLHIGEGVEESYFRTFP